MGICALIVDDSSVMRRIVERSLRQAGVDVGNVLEAGNGAEALEIVNSRRVDLILSDINMPVMDGLEFVRRLQSVENAKGTPVVMITTEGSESNVLQALSSGARGWLLMTLLADCNLLIPAPTVPRPEATLLIAVLMRLNASAIRRRLRGRRHRPRRN